MSPTVAPFFTFKSPQPAQEFAFDGQTSALASRCLREATFFSISAVDINATKRRNKTTMAQPLPQPASQSSLHIALINVSIMNDDNMDPTATGVSTEFRRRRYHRRRRIEMSAGLILLLVMIVSMTSLPCRCLQPVGATEVTWVPNDDKEANSNGKQTAQTAPRSQKYWNENNIERPDYAKTDAELRQEEIRRDPNKARRLWFTLQVVVFLIGVSFPIGYYVIWPRMKHGAGSRLGHGSGTGGFQDMAFPSWLLNLSQTKSQKEEEARLARLSKFGTMPKDEETKKDK